MAKQASSLDLLLDLQLDVRPLRAALESDVCRRAMVDLSVEEAERRALTLSQHQVRIRIQLPRDDRTISHPNLLVYIANHLTGRCPYPTVECGNILDIMYWVDADDEASKSDAQRFARSVVDVLGLSDRELVSVGVEAVDQQLRTNILSVAGIDPPELRLV